MARFTGTFNEFYEWADARTRFWITKKTQTQRRRLGECPRCKSAGVSLTAAHVTPRKDIVRAAVGASHDEQALDLDLDEAWTAIREAHRPFAEKFRYLCEACHKAADSPSLRA